LHKQNAFSRTAVSVYFFIFGLIFSTWASRIPSFKDSFGFNEAELGAILFSLPLGALAALPLSGWIVHKFGSKLIGISSLIIYSTLLFLLSITNSVPVFAVVLFFFGFIGNVTNISMNTQGLSIQQLLGKPILSSLHAMWSVGAFLAAVVSGLTMELGYSTKQHFLLMAIIIPVISLGLSSHLVKDKNVEGPQKIFALPTKGLLLFGFICFCVAMSEGAMVDWSSLYYRMALEDMQKISTAGYTAFAFFMAVGRFMGDRLVQSLGYKRVIKLNGLFILAGITIALAVKIPWAVIIGFSMVGLGVSSVFPVVYIIAAKNKSMAPSAALAAVSSVGFTGFLLGPPIIGFVAQEIGLRLALVIVAILGFVIWLLAFRIKAEHTD
jgi:MFS family permease